MDPLLQVILGLLGVLLQVLELLAFVAYKCCSHIIGLRSYTTRDPSTVCGAAA